MRRKGVTAAERIQERMDTPAGSSEHLRKRKVRLREVIDILNERGVEPIGAICDVLPQLDPSCHDRKPAILTSDIASSGVKSDS